MIKGSFDLSTRRPYLQGLLLFPNLHLRGRVDFLVDTGSDCTILHPADAALIGVEYKNLKGAVPAKGTTGISSNYQESGLLLFLEENGRIPVYRVRILIAPRTEDNYDLPSLLGRDVLDKWRMLYDPNRNRLEFIVIRADAILRAK